MPLDDFENHGSGLDSPAQHGIVAAQSDSVDLATTSRGISFGGAGALKVDILGGETVTLPSGALAAGYIHPLRVTRVWSTGTTATDIYVWW